MTTETLTDRPDRGASIERRLQAGGVVHAIIGLSAILGGGALCVLPNGSLLRLDVALLAPSPFTDYLLPGLALYLLGVINACTAFLILNREPKMEGLSLVVGAGVLLWLGAEIAMIRTVDPLVIVYGILAWFIVLNAAWIRYAEPLPPPLTPHAH